MSGRYLDKYERRDGVWRFIHCTGMMDWASMTAEEIGQLLPPGIDRPNKIPAVDRSDPSYSVLTMFAADDTAGDSVGGEASPT